MKPVIQVSNLSKSYQLSHQNKASYNTLKDDFARIVKGPFGGGIQNEKETFWALKDINFEVNQGEVFGIVGKNGSGKSTLLKILSRIVDPTTGAAIINGKIASLLEVGTGFHPELTGRENIYFNGSMIGMSKKEISSKFDEIVAFSGVEKFLDTPVKFYSSGMFVRLAFSVAAHLDSEVLIIDEVLSVGDIQFQKRSLNKMTSIAKEGRTILFVSHSMSNVKQLCDRALLLEKGKVKFVGETEFVTDQYLSKNMFPGSKTGFKNNPDKPAQFISIDICNSAGEAVDALEQDEPWSIVLKYKVRKSLSSTVVALEILNNESQPIFMTTDTDFSKKISPLEPGEYKAKIDFGGLKFVPGSFYIRASIQSPGVVAHDVRENILLRVRQNDQDVRLTYFKGKYMGYLSTKIEWDIKKGS